ncbi:MAG TPA: crossover junction endodeoxyribonuclease RuvC [Anaeromyxobacteraceae bacterium]|nr:crossover junction endodeoxyribonuclease RuvC [Anaeromyxobacteraceae bacterium]
MVVVGVDPGTQRCGYGVVARTGSRLRVVESGVLVPGDHDLPRRLSLILDGLEALFARAGADAVAVETVFAGVSPRSALVLGQARGVVLAAAARAGLPVVEYAPQQAKLALTGNGRAEKAQMIRMARALFGVAADLADEADAIALAVCHVGRGALRAPVPPRAASRPAPRLPPRRRARGAA